MIKKCTIARPEDDRDGDRNYSRKMTRPKCFHKIQAGWIAKHRTGVSLDVILNTICDIASGAVKLTIRYTRRHRRGMQKIVGDIICSEVGVATEDVDESLDVVSFYGSHFLSLS
ncbi:hypothetical protein D3C80_842240 [compost metagenome]